MGGAINDLVQLVYGRRGTCFSGLFIFAIYKKCSYCNGLVKYPPKQNMKTRNPIHQL